MAIIQVPEKLAEQIKDLQEEEDFYQGEIEGICSAFTWITDAMVAGGEFTANVDDKTEALRAFASLISLMSYRKLLDMLRNCTIVEK